MSDRAEVRNAADPNQVKRAQRIERQREGRFRASTIAVMKSAEGRAFVRGLLERCRVYNSVFDTDVARMAYLAGRQDCGHEIQALTVDASEELYLLMEEEARLQRQRDERSTDAAHTPAADQGKP